MPENTEAIAETAEVQTETVESAELPQSSEDVWNKDIDFTLKEEVTDDDTNGEGSPSDMPSETETEVAPKESETVEETETEEEPELPKMTRSNIRDKIINPFRDHDAPITDVLKGLAELNPQRANELIEKVAFESAERFPDEWLSAITGIEGITKEQVVEYHKRFSGTELNTPQVAEDKDKQVFESELADAISSLDELYPNWRASDEDIIDSDIPLVKFVRASMEAKPSGKETELEQKVAKLTEKLAELEPKFTEFEKEKEAKFEEQVKTTYVKAFEDFRAEVEKDSRPKFFTETGLAVTEADPPEFKDFKAAILSRFESNGNYMSDFDVFAVEQFSQAEKLAKIVQRVDKNIANAARLEAAASIEKDKDKAETAKTKAQALRDDAANDKDVLTVLNKKAMKEFAESPQIKPLMDAMVRESQLRQQIARLTGGRVELIGQTAANGSTESWKDEIKKLGQEKGSVWDSDILDKRLAAMDR